MDEEDVQSVVVGGVTVTSKPQRRPRKAAAAAAATAAADELTREEGGEVYDFTADLLLPPTTSSSSSSSSNSSSNNSSSSSSSNNSSSSGTIMRMTGLEYLDHTADIIVHAVSPSLGALFACAAFGMFNYMTDLLLIKPTECMHISARGRDLAGLLFDFLNEMHALYGESYFFVSRIKDIRFRTEATPAAAAADAAPAAAADTPQQQQQQQQQQQLLVECRVFGERFDKNRHSQGTEIKAVTFHQLKLLLTRQQQQQQQEQQQQQQEQQQQEQEQQQQQEQQEMEVVEDIAGLADLGALEAKLKDGDVRLETYVVLDI
ncbi:hypothetical protein Emed_004866 [Eimeria media]